MFVAKFQVFFPYSESTEENHELIREDGLFSGRVLKPRPPTYEKVLATRLRIFS